MCDIGQVLPDFIYEGHEDIVNALEDRNVTTSDFISATALDLSRRINAPIPAIEAFRTKAVSHLHSQLEAGKNDFATQAISTPDVISLIDPTLNEAIGGGIRTGCITEVVGPSGVGKTQFLLSTLLSAQLKSPSGLGRPTLYISTEHALPTQRLSGIIEANPVLSSARPKPSLAQILTLHAPDLETQDHVFQFQLPVALSRHNVGLVVIDSIAANYRAEEIRGERGESRGSDSRGQLMSNRTAELVRLGASLREMARKYNCSFLVANQVSDRLGPAHVAASDIMGLKSPTSSPAGVSSSISSSQGTLTPGGAGFMENRVLPATVMSLDHQQRWFTGWGDQRPADIPMDTREGPTLKTPTLGLVWTNQITCRIALHKEAARITNGSVPTIENNLTSANTSAILGGADWTPRRWRRRIRLVFAPWARACSEDEGGVEYEIWAGGLRSIDRDG